MVSEDTSILLDGTKWEEEDIVISGISGRFPESNSVQEFEDNLLAGVDMVRDDPRRFQTGLYGAVSRYGMMKDLSRFDASFFNIHPKQAERMDPQIRNILEVAHEAIVDAGLHPDDLNGSKTGVIVGVASSETQDKWSQMPDKINGYEYIGCTRTMFANRISYKYNLKGPSYSIDTASSTTLVAFQQAYDLIKDGICDACFVCGTDLVLNPCVCLMFQCLNMLSPEGKCKAFDQSGDGYVRSEGAIAVLLQKAKNAKRVYAKVLGAGSNCDGYKDEGITFPSEQQQVVLFSRTAKIAGINPSIIDFMEAHGSATRVGDPQEMNAVTEVFIKGRSKPLMTGSVKSNMGHGEPASALSAVIKICVAMECGIIPPNLHYNNPNPDIPALLDGRLQVVTKPTPWNGGLVAINSFGVGGANGHTLLLSNKKQKISKSDIIPRIVCVSGVTENAVKSMLNKISDLPRDAELFALLNNIHRKNIKGHSYRGYIILDNADGIKIEKMSNEPGICFILSGICDQIYKIGKEMLKLDVFKKSVQKCQEILKNIDTNIDIEKILISNHAPNSVLMAVISTIVFQLGLIDVLTTLQINPTYLIGLNIGEIVCGYSDGSYSVDKALQLAYYLGKLLESASNSAGAIALMGNGLNNEIQHRLPDDIAVIANLSPKFSLISGPISSINKLIDDLSTKGAYLKFINSCGANLASFNSPKFVQQFKQRIDRLLSGCGQPSSKWLSLKNQDSSISVEAQFNNNIASISHFQDAMESIPENTILIEIGGTFIQDVLRPLEKNGHGHKYINLLDNGCELNDFLNSVGRLYNAGFQPQIQNLYPAISFPVSHGTPKIQSLIEWDHSKKWNVVSFGAKDASLAGEVNIVVYFDKEEFNFLLGNLFNEEHVFPKSFYVYLVWKALSKLQTKPLEEIPLVIEHICFLRDVEIMENADMNFYINLLSGSEKFEIWENNMIVAMGTVRIPMNINKEHLPFDLIHSNPNGDDKKESKITKYNIYRHLNAQHYRYTENFQKLAMFNWKAQKATIEWNNNWMIFLESIFQVAVLQTEFTADNRIYLSNIRRIVINPKLHISSISNPVSLEINNQLNVLKSGGIEVIGINMKYSKIPFQPMETRINLHEFVPFISSKGTNLKNAASASLLFAFETWSKRESAKIIEIATGRTNESLLSPNICRLNPFIQFDIIVYSNEPESLPRNFESEGIKSIFKDIFEGNFEDECDLLICGNAMFNPILLHNILSNVSNGGFLLLEEDTVIDFENIDIVGLQHISTLFSQMNQKFYILFQKTIISESKTLVINVKDESNDWLRNLLHGISQPNIKILIVVKNLQSMGSLNVIKCIKSEFPEKIISVISVEDNSTEFSLANSNNIQQLKKDYPVNVFKNGKWGCYLPIPVENLKIDAEYAKIGPILDSPISYIQENPLKFSSENNVEKELCDVYCIGMHLFKQNNIYLSEFSGKNSRGDAVFGLKVGSEITTTVAADKDLLWEMPCGWSFEDGASIPVSYILAYYGLCISSQLKFTDKILIYGTTPISMATINILLKQEFQIYVIVETEQQKMFYQKQFLQLNGNQIIVSNDNSFYLDVLEASDGGVQMIFNTMKNNSTNLQAFVNCSTENAQIICFENEIPVEDNLGSTQNMRCITINRISVEYLFKNESFLSDISTILKQGLQKGEVKPIPYLVFKDTEFDEAYKSSTENLGFKTILKIRDLELNTTGKEIFSAYPSSYFDENKSYIILGGGIKFGIFVANWIISKGAKYLIIASNDKNEDGLLKLYEKRWQYQNVTAINIFVSDYSIKNCESLFNKAKQFGPVGGIFDLTEYDFSAGVSFADLNANNFKPQLHPKVQFVSNMDQLTRKNCEKLDYFVVFSVVQSCEVYGKCHADISIINGLIEGIIINRKFLNLPSILIEWGIIGDSTEIKEYNSSLISNRLQPQSVKSCIQTLDQLLQSSGPVVSSCAILKQTGTVSKSKSKAIQEGVAKFLGIKDPSSIHSTVTLLDLGLDSLIGTDVQNFLESDYGIILTTQEVRELTFEKLKDLAESFE